LREGQPGFVPVENVGLERHAGARLADRLEHGRKSRVPVHQGLDPVARQQRPLDHALDHAGQHLEVPRLGRQMAVQLLRQTSRLGRQRAVAVQVRAQRRGPPPDAVDAKDEIEQRARQRHQPNAPEPPDSRARIALVENHVSRRHGRQHQGKAGQDEVPDLVCLGPQRRCEWHRQPVLQTILSGNPIPREDLELGAFPLPNHNLALNPT